jgi:TPR repeat protein
MRALVFMFVGIFLYADGIKGIQKGDIDMNFIAGVMYYLGDGVKKDHNIAKEYFQKAANSGHKKAKYNLDFMSNKMNVAKTKEPKKVIKAVKKEEPQKMTIFVNNNNNKIKSENTKRTLTAQQKFELGNSYLSGDGVRQSYEKAFAFYKDASDLGHHEAVASLYKLCQNNPVSCE